MCSIWIVLSICARCPTITLTLPFATHPTAMRRQVRPLQTADCDSTEATDGIATRSHKLPPPNQQQQADWNPHTRRNVGDKVQKTVNHAYGGRFSRYSVGGYKLTASYNALTGMLPHNKSSLMNFFVLVKTKLYGVGIIFAFHLQDAFSYGENYLFPRSSPWQCVNMRGHHSMVMQNYLSQFHNVESIA